MNDYTVVDGIVYKRASKEKQFKNKLQPYLYPVDFAERLKPENGTGKSTGYALLAISNAMTQPEVPVDLYEIRGEDSTHARHYIWNEGGFVSMIEDILRKLDLKFFNIDRAKGTLTYNIALEN